jgi:hypothetical protein
MELRPTGPSAAWTPLDMNEGYDRVWAAFESSFGFRAGTSADAWPAIREPTPSVTFDLGSIDEGPRLAAARDAINSEALRCFVWALPHSEQMIVLDWQHPAHLFRPAVQAVTEQPEWPVTIYPNGDYYAFITADLTEGTFGHPWEQTLCVFGERLIGSLAATLAVWLPVIRRDGLAVE